MVNKKTTSTRRASHKCVISSRYLAAPEETSSAVVYGVDDREWEHERIYLSLLLKFSRASLPLLFLTLALLQQSLGNEDLVLRGDTPV